MVLVFTEFVAFFIIENSSEVTGMFVLFRTDLFLDDVANLAAVLDERVELERLLQRPPVLVGGGLDVAVAGIQLLLALPHRLGVQLATLCELVGHFVHLTQLLL